MWRQALKPFVYGLFRFVVIILYGHTAATNMHQLTGDFYTIAYILGHSVESIKKQMKFGGGSATTVDYIDIRMERVREVIEAYHNALYPKSQ